MYKSAIVIFSLFLIILVCVAVIFERGFNTSSIPKTIYTYWHDHDNIPLVVTKCIDTWRIHNPDYKIIVLNIEKVKEMCDVDLTTLNIPVEFPARYADFARLLVIAKYGGLWLDSTIICTKPFTWVHDIIRKDKVDFIGYKSPQTTSLVFPVIENWFFAAPPNSIFVQDWLNEATKTRSFPTEGEYVEYVKAKTDVDLQGIDVMLPYLIMHLCNLVIQHRNKDSYNLHIMDSTEGPFKYLEDNQWIPSQSIEALCTNNALRSDIVKLRGPEREYVENNIVTCEQKLVDPSIYYVIKNNH